MARALETEVEELEEGEERGKRRLLLPALLLLGLIAAGAVAYPLLLGPSDEEPEATEPEEGPVIEIPDLTANLAGEDMRYARVSMAAVLRADAEVSAVEQRLPILRDAALSELAAMRPDELRTADGLAQLKARMTARAQEAYPDDEVLRILVTELVVQ